MQIGILVLLYDTVKTCLALQEAKFAVTIQNIQYAHALRMAGREINQRNMDALMGADLDIGDELPTYENMGRDFPQSGSGG